MPRYIVFDIQTEEANVDDSPVIARHTFMDANFSGDVHFSKAIFSMNANFAGAAFNEESLTFENARFQDPSMQVDTCRRAKIVLERIGNREEAGYHGWLATSITIYLPQDV